MRYQDWILNMHFYMIKVEIKVILVSDLRVKLKDETSDWN